MFKGEFRLGEYKWPCNTGKATSRLRAGLSRLKPASPNFRNLYVLPVGFFVGSFFLNFRNRVVGHALLFFF